MEAVDRSFHQQGSPEWFAERLGKFTSSKVSSLLVTSKKAGQMFGDGAWTYIYEKMDEITTGIVNDGFKGNDATDWGLAHENDAYSLYEIVKGIKTQECGFVIYNEAFGGSPDRFVGEDGILETKCPYIGANHMRLMDLECADDFKIEYPKYYSQIQGNLLTTKRVWCDFISYDPRQRLEFLSMKILRIYRDEAMIKNIDERVDAGMKIVTDRVELMIKQGKELFKIAS